MRLIDYPSLERNTKLFKPKMIVAGFSCCSRKLDYARYSDVVHCTAALHFILFTRFKEIWCYIIWKKPTGYHGEWSA